MRIFKIDTKDKLVYYECYVSKYREIIYFLPSITFVYNKYVGLHSIIFSWIKFYISFHRVNLNTESYIK